MSGQGLNVGDTVPDFCVIDGQRLIRHIVNSKIRMRKHAEEALRVVRSLRGTASRQLRQTADDTGPRSRA